MTPQIPVYLLSFVSIVRLLVTIIALGLIWLGAARMPASAKSRYTTAGVLSAALIGWVAVAQYLGAANTYFAASDTAVPTVLFGLLIPLAVAAIALWRSESIARLVSAIPLHWLVAAQVYRVAGGIFLVLWADGPALAICPAGGDWGRCDGQRCRRRGCAVGTKRNWRSQGNIRLVPFRNRRPRRGSHHGGNDLSRTGASSCIRGA